MVACQLMSCYYLRSHIFYIDISLGNMEYTPLALNKFRANDTHISEVHAMLMIYKKKERKKRKKEEKKKKKIYIYIYIYIL